MKKMKVIFLSLGLYLICISIVSAQADIQIIEQSLESAFRDNITGYLKAESQNEITQVEFFYRVVGQPATTKQVADFEAGTSIEASYAIDQRSTYFPPGTEIEYWWKVTDDKDNSLRTERERYLYLDERHDFETLSNDRLTLYWYRGGDSFGQSLYDQANLALDQLEENVGVTIKDPIKIFIYGDHEDLMDAISVGAQEWTGGQAFTNVGVVVMGVSPDNLRWGLKATTHELTHLIIHQATDNPYNDLPRWLDEGLAVYNEDPNRLDSQFRSSFQRAVDNDSLMTLQTLSSTFPASPEEANLAYGQSGAIVKFIVDTYGTEAMQQLLEIFSEGALYDDALEEALGVNMRQLNNAWLESLDLPLLPEAQAQAQATPTAAEETATPEAEVETAEPDPTVEPTPVENTAEPTQDEPQEGSEGGGIPCFSGMLPIFMLGFVFVMKGRKN